MKRRESPKGFKYRIITWVMNLIIASKQDLAGMNIANHLRELFDFEKIKKDQYQYKDCILSFIEKDSVYAEFPETQFIDIDFIIFASRHSSEAGIPSLTAHTPGNFGSADYGGTPKEICFSNPIAQKLALKELQTQKEELSLDFDVSMEATHHGPLTGKPTMFIEIGSSKEQWTIPKAGEAVAVSLMKAAEYKEHDFKKAVGIGGGHYCQKHTKVMLYRDYAIGHVLAKYVPITEENVKKAVDKMGDAMHSFWTGKAPLNGVQYQKCWNSLDYLNSRLKNC